MGESWMPIVLQSITVSCLLFPLTGTLTTVHHLLTRGPTPKPGQSRVSIPLSRRPHDVCMLAFFALNLIFITYIVDLEQIVISNADDFEYPVWPPRMLVDLIHWYARAYDPVLIARPPWWRAAIWVDILFYGPFYAVAFYAFVRGCNWIRIPTMMYSCSILTVMVVLLMEEALGRDATPHLAFVMLLNSPWVVMPFLLLIRMLLSPLPFSAVKRSD